MSQRAFIKLIFGFALLSFYFIVPTDIFAESIIVDGNCTLVDAIIAANTDRPRGNCIAGNGEDVIFLATDVYLTESVDFTRGSNGLPPITSTITIQSEGFKIERMANAPEFRIFLVLKDEEHSFDGHLTLNNVAIGGGSGHEGAGIYNEGGIVKVNDSTITRNTGGGFYGSAGIANDSGIVEITNSVISENGGYGLYNCGIASVTGTLFSENIQAIFNCIDSELTIMNSGFTDNRLDQYFKNGASAVENEGKASISGSIFYRNEVAIVNTGYGELTIENSIFADNSGNVVGNDNQTAITNSTFSGNTGSAVYNMGNTVIKSSTIVFNNTSDDEGGGGIVAAESGLLSAETLVTVSNSIIAYNNGADCISYSAYAKFSGNANRDSDTTCPVSQIITGLDSNLTRNGGTTQTHALLTGSNAIDTGDTQFCPPADQRGVSRTGICDIGAYEFEP